jgi:hypothetical protein
MSANIMLRKLLNEEQDPAVVEKVHEKFSGILTTGEDVLYIAVQKKPLVNVSPDCVILTNKRLVICRPKLLGGFTFEDHLWREISDVHLKEGMVGGTLTVQTIQNKALIVDYLPKAQARKTYSIAQEMEERVHEERRLRELEDKRAAAGGVVVQSASVPAPTSTPALQKEDPIEILGKLKKLVDGGLITAAEYEAKKAEILSRM